MRAVVLAGGKGTRLRPYTTLIPKPLVPLGGRFSILEIIIMQLREAGFQHITLAVNHLSRLIMSYFGDGSQLGIRIDYSIEESELSTIGPLTLIDDLPESFLVMNGDIISDLDYRSFFEGHVRSGSEISVSAFNRRVKVDFGVISYDSAGYLTGFQEKPVYDFSVSMGIYCLNRTVVARLPRGERYGFDDLMFDSLGAGRKVDIKLFEGYWLDIGRPDDYEHADANFEEIAKRLNIV
jgi:NDP-sugar pyrophosphorylase family protein